MSVNVSSGINMKFLYAGIAIALLISVLAPFLASPDPDGLESAAGGVVDEKTLSELEGAEPFVESPMPDYSIEGQGKMGEVIAIVAGTLLVLGISFALGKAAKK
ncbi:PDGLE domain-containing protein [Methanolobus mangrovi]|uniref:PDGLE domain-containing protein n=1 Tax=Methanolobus mangrovi TaxID=3072977 RepID=A0AA51UG46_9EURY|nr:PDGLE domain-containing protein [Methanolobus mangrovi]WMW21532.1 PDGLE domain-containing protein [Methanolobus mangrovi]